MFSRSVDNHKESHKGLSVRKSYPVFTDIRQLDNFMARIVSDCNPWQQSFDSDEEGSISWVVWVRFADFLLHLRFSSFLFQDVLGCIEGMVFFPMEPPWQKNWTTRTKDCAARQQITGVAKTIVTEIRKSFLSVGNHAAMQHSMCAWCILSLEVSCCKLFWCKNCSFVPSWRLWMVQLCWLLCRFAPCCAHYSDILSSH